MSDPTRDELVDFVDRLRPIYGDDDDDSWEMSRERVIYWYAYAYHGGQWSNLYSVLCTSEYRPGALENGIETDDFPDIDLYYAVVEEYGG